MTKPPSISEADYRAFEVQLESTPQGQAFLRRRDTKMRLASAARVRKMMRKFKIVAPAEKDRPSAAQFLLLRKELRGISDYIRRTRSEIASLLPDDSGHSRIATATSELDAVVAATEQATSDILSCAERIQESVIALSRSDSTGPLLDGISARLIDIMTACSFQDITGQRVTKVVNALRYIEQRVATMTAIWSGNAGDALANPEGADTRPDAHLLNGPALSGGVSQDDVDSLFATGDNADRRASRHAAAWPALQS